LNKLSSEADDLADAKGRLFGLVRDPRTQAHQEVVYAIISDKLTSMASRCLDPVRGESRDVGPTYYVSAYLAQVVAQCPDPALMTRAMLAYLAARCPLTVPYLPPAPPPGASDVEMIAYRRATGPWAQPANQALLPVTGFVRVYACWAQTPLPARAAGAHPHGLDELWAFLARLLASPPVPDLSLAALLQTFKVAGARLQLRYGVQFHKLLRAARAEFLPLVKNDPALAEYLELALANRFPYSAGEISFGQ
jgi:hypothetical protein